MQEIQRKEIVLEGRYQSGLPSFVYTKLVALLEERYDCELRQIPEAKRTLTVTQLPGHISSISGIEVFREVSFWIAGHDSAHLYIHMGGSGYWIKPDNHYLFFEPVDPEWLRYDKYPSLTTWWVIDSRTFEVWEVLILDSPDEVPEGAWQNQPGWES